MFSIIEKFITINGYKYKKNKIIRGKNTVYVEYRNEELRKIEFFEIHNQKLLDITDKDDLNFAIQKNYICDL